MTRPIENGTTTDTLSKYELLIHYTLTKKPKRNINKEEMRQIKVNEERERRENINKGFALLQELLKVLFLTTYYKRKLSKADLLRKGDTFNYL
ncbi:33659_t:CDS:2 [Gigaspora margarita]|uniref:33659_t:CDS:1 n=1 Tax=Gigaspora margarita TaxID=4874 RepID=A0ABN7VD47_GIGMA|nr:33659_t:CDS:2 [Gigaspora margarita]